MEKTQEIRYRFADIGRWMARCDHNAKVIELNSKEFANLSPLYRDYIWVHECVHLLTDIRDESKTNEISDGIFLLRSSSEHDRQERQRFLEVSDSPVSSGHSSVLVVMIIIATILFIILKK